MPGGTLDRWRQAPDYLPGPLQVLVQELGADTTAMILAQFLAELDARLARLATLAQALDRAVLRREAHSLKSAAASMGLEALSSAAAQLEHAAELATPDALRDDTAGLTALAQRALSLLPPELVRPAA